jgi:LysR family transcriptional regulator for metE and metH
LTLFERKSAPVAFTPAGQRLLELAQAVIPAVEKAERDVARLGGHGAGKLRIAVECHTCFDWLMPSMDALRLRWPEVEQDIVSGFQSDPVGLLHQDRADVAIVSEVDADERDVAIHPLFEFDIVAILPLGHRLLAQAHLEARDFADQTLITYPVPDEMLDLVRQVLRPAGVEPPRRTTELTVAMLQLVASGRGFAALPLWAVQTYLQRGYVAQQRIGQNGLTGRLYAVTRQAGKETGRDDAYLEDFVQVMRETSLRNLPGIRLL